jgi:hypothetical protein
MAQQGRTDINDIFLTGLPPDGQSASIERPHRRDAGQQHIGSNKFRVTH